eukprot:SAG25_NODE_2644_length_1472_cov_1.610342_1_plen_229_part_00
MELCKLPCPSVHLSICPLIWLVLADDDGSHTLYLSNATMGALPVPLAPTPAELWDKTNTAPDIRGVEILDVHTVPPTVTPLILCDAVCSTYPHFVRRGPNDTSIFLKGSALELDRADELERQLATATDRADELERQLATANQRERSMCCSQLPEARRAPILLHMFAFAYPRVELSAAGLVQATAPMSSRLIAFDTETREAAEFIGASVEIFARRSTLGSVAGEERHFS